MQTLRFQATEAEICSMCRLKQMRKNELKQKLLATARAFRLCTVRCTSLRRVKPVKCRRNKSV